MTHQFPLDLYAAVCRRPPLLVSPRDVDSPVARIVDELSAIFDQPQRNQAMRRIMISLPTSPEFVASVIATWLTNSVGTAVGIGASRWEIERAVATTGPAWIVHMSTDNRFDHLCSPGTHISIPTVRPSLVASPTTNQTGDQPLGPNDAWIAPTSGSTGTSKYAVLTYDNLRHNSDQAVTILDISEDDTILAFTPSNFSYALNQINSAILGGSQLTLWPHGLGAPQDVITALHEWDINKFSANPTSFELLLRGSGTRRLDQLRFIMSGGQPLHARLAKSLLTLASDAILVSGYGCTEYTNRITYRYVSSCDLTEHEFLPVGIPIADTILSFGETLADGAEIHLSGRSLMRGYLDELSSTSDAIPSFATGDLGRLDANGDLVLTGRTKTLINVGNEMVSPEEIESVAATVDGVRQCAVTATPHQILGESPCALVTVESHADKYSVSMELRRRWRNQLSPSKLPRRIYFVEESDIPRTAYGKIDRRGLSEVANTIQKMNKP